MNRQLSQYFEDLSDAVPSASPETLLDLKFQLETLLAQVDQRLDDSRQNDRQVALEPAIRGSSANPSDLRKVITP